MVKVITARSVKKCESCKNKGTLICIGCQLATNKKGKETLVNYEEVK